MGKSLSTLMSEFELFCNEYNITLDFEKLGYNYKFEKTLYVFITYRYAEQFKKTL